jgi:hypothetical protein
MSDIIPVIEKRKKGRPRKIANPENNIMNENTTQKDKEPEIKIKKKRGRKAALKYFGSSIRKQIPLKTNIVDNENDILCIDLKDYNKNDLFETEYNIEFNDKFNDNNETLASVDFDENETKLTNDFSKLQIVNTSVSSVTSVNQNINQNVNQIDVQKDNIKKGYFQLFNDFDKWKDGTDIKCWWCCNSFDNVPIGMPVNYNHNLNKFHVKGIFCSFACMLAYFNTTKYKESKKYLVNYLYKKMTGCNKILFKPAPLKCCLKEYGGHLSIDEFRKLSTELKSYKMIEYPLFMSRDYIAEVDLATIKQVNNKVFNGTIKTILLDDKKIEEAKCRISKNESTSVLNNTIEDFINN